MRMTDFEYNGTRLSDLGLSIGFFNGANDSQTIGNNVSITKVKPVGSNKYYSSGYEYDNVFEIEFGIIKKPCVGTNNYIISSDELSNITRWLNRKGFYKFKPIYNDGSMSDVYYEGTFNIEIVKAGENVVGLNLSFTTNAPYGFLEPIEFSFQGSNFTIVDVSDEVGYLYADVEIECLQNGDLLITNELDPDNKISIKNCKSGEIIKMYGDTKIITTSLSSHEKIYNDFNYRYFRIVNEYNNRVNKYSSNLNCKINVKYSPIKKVGFVL